jgi:hypothetical protein
MYHFLLESPKYTHPLVLLSLYFFYSSMSSGRKPHGRRKIEIKRMTNDSNMEVTFSKRRSELLKKVSELRTLCGATVLSLYYLLEGRYFPLVTPMLIRS